MPQGNAHAPGPRLQPVKPRPKLTAHPKPKSASPLQSNNSPGSKAAKVRPLIVQMVAKQIQKLLTQRNLLTSPTESNALEPKQAGKK